MTAPSVPGAAHLVGREADLATLSVRLDGAMAGMGHAVFITGEPGIGKTRLAAVLAARARDRGARVLWGRCSDDAGAPAFWPWIQIIRGCIRDQDPEVLLAQMGPGAADIAQVVAQVRERLPHLPAPPPLEPEQARFRFFDSATAFLTTAAEVQPLVLVLDDLHWADTPSLLLLEFLGREMHTSRLLVVETYRDVEVDHEHPLARTLAALTRAQMHERVVLHGLDEHDVARCIAAITGVEPAPVIAAAVHRETAGNPFFVTEIARLMASERQDSGGASTVSHGARPGPHGLRQVLDSRLAHLPTSCHRVLTLAAVIGCEFGLTELERVTELAGDPLLEVLEQAEIARVITAVPGAAGRYRFAHALIREALYEELPTIRRIRLHRQVAEALEALHGTASNPHLAQLAHHFVQAAPGGDIDTAVAYARQAGDSALALLAYEEAARYYRLALQALELRPQADESQHCALLLALGEAQNWSGEADMARQTFRSAAAIAGRLADAEGVARAALGYGAVADAGVVDNVRVALLKQAREALGDHDSLLRVMVLAGLSAALYWSDQPERSIRWSQQALEVATRLADPVALAYALNAQRESLWRPEHLRDRIAVAAAMREAAAAAGDQELTLQACRWMIADALESGNVAAMDKEIAAHARLAHAVRQPLHLWYVARWQAMRALLAGRLGEAEELVQRTLALGRRTQRQDATALFIVQWGVLRRMQGRAAELEPVVRELAERYPDIPAWRAGLAAVYADLGRAAEARREIDRLATGAFEDLPRDANWLVAVTSLAQVCAFLADRERAAVLYDLLLPYRGHTVVAGAAIACHGAVAHYLGLLAATLARWDAAQTHFEDALALHTRMGAQPWIATTQYDYAAMLFARGRPGDRTHALELVTRALETAQELAMTALAARALTLRDRIAPTHRVGGPQGAKSASARADCPDRLTAREGEVARLLARGLTNRQIAAALVISGRTADAHVANILGKLGFCTRAQIAAWAVEHGLHLRTEA